MIDEILWTLAAALGAWLIVATTLLFKRKAISFRPDHLRIMAGDVRNYFRFRATDHRKSLDELYSLLGLPAGSLPATRGRAASPDFLLILARHIITHRPQRVLECGPGVSTIVIAAALEKAGAGEAWCLEHLEGYGRRVQESVDRQGLGHRAHVLHTPLVPHEIEGRSWDWYDISQLPDGPWDMVIIDGPPASVGPSARYPAGPLVLSRLSPDGHVFVDDADRQHDREICQRFAREFSLRPTSLKAEKGCCRLSHAETLDAIAILPESGAAE